MVTECILSTKVYSNVYSKHKKVQNALKITM